MTTQGPTSSKCAADLRWEMCLNSKGLATVKARLMSSFIISMYALYTLMARRARPLACGGGGGGRGGGCWQQEGIHRPWWMGRGQREPSKHRGLQCCTQAKTKQGLTVSGPATRAPRFPPP